MSKKTKKKVKKSKKNKLYDKLFRTDTLLNRLEAKFITNPPTPSAAEWGEWDDIRTAQKNNHPIAFRLFHDLPSFLSVKQRQLSDFIWWFKYRYQKKHQYHNVYTALTPGWHDESTIYLYASMQVLSDFVENTNFMFDEDVGEKGLKRYIDAVAEDLNPKKWPEWERKQGAKYKKFKLAETNKILEGHREILSIYTWWKYLRKLDHLSLEQHQNDFYSKKSVPMAVALSSKPMDKKTKKIYDAERAEHKKLMDREEELTNKDTEMLVRLAKIRDRLWH